MSARSTARKLLPRTWVDSIDQLRRDVSMVARGFTGNGPAPFTARRAASHRWGTDDARPTVAAVLAPRTLRVARVVRETKDAVSLHLEDPTGAEITFRPGQFFTVMLPIDGEIVRRAYSVSSSCLERSRVAITIKRVAGGRASNFINDHVAVGDAIQVLGPSGSFGIEPSAEAARHVVLVAGGSGITPMMAIARAVLSLEPNSKVTLLYGNRGDEDVIFKEAIADLAHRHEPRFVVRHVLEQPPPEWSGGAGLLARDVVAAEVESLGCGLDAEYFVCGPEIMMQEARAALVARGVPEERIKEERFNSPHLRPAKGGDAAGSPQLLTLKGHRGGAREVYVAPGQTVLEAGLASGVQMPYSCAMGGCAACKCKVSLGAVEMEEPNCLTADERAAGYVLACVARLSAPATIEVDAEVGG